MSYNKRPYGNLFAGGKLLKLFRVECGLRQNHVSEKLGIRGNKLSLIENGQAVPTKKQLSGLLEEYKKTVEDVPADSDIITILKNKL